MVISCKSPRLHEQSLVKTRIGPWIEDSHQNEWMWEKQKQNGKGSGGMMKDDVRGERVHKT